MDDAKEYKIKPKKYEKKSFLEKNVLIVWKKEIRVPNALYQIIMSKFLSLPTQCLNLNKGTLRRGEANQKCTTKCFNFLAIIIPLNIYLFELV